MGESSSVRECHCDGRMELIGKALGEGIWMDMLDLFLPGRGTPEVVTHISFSSSVESRQVIIKDVTEDYPMAAIADHVTHSPKQSEKVLQVSFVTNI